MNYEVNGHEVLETEEVVTPNQTATVRRHYCFARKIVISGQNTVIVNAALPLSVKWQDWQNNDLLEEVSEINITVTGPAQTTDFTLTPIVGQAEFDLVFPATGIYKIQANAGFPCDAVELEVVVSG